MTDLHRDPNPIHAAVAWLGVVCGLTAATLEAPAPPVVIARVGPAIVAARITPAEAQQWADFAFGVVNKVFTLVNIAVGVWQSAQLAMHRRRNKRHPPPAPHGAIDVSARGVVPNGTSKGEPTPSPG